jgi:Putative Ig domain
MENNRTKFLLFALGGLLGIVFLWKGVKKYAIDPVTTRKTQLAALEQNIELKEREKDMVIRSQALLKDFTNRSLPPKEIDAQRLYKEWVNDLADVVGFDGLVVEPGRRDRYFVGQGRLRKPLYGAVQVIVSGKTTFDRLCRFLYYFQRVDIPQRVVELRMLSDENEGNPLLKVRITVEALSVSAAKPRKRLFPETKLQSPLGAFDEAIRVADAAGFPQSAGFHVHVGKNLVTVTSRKGNEWKVRPGVDPAPNPDADRLVDVPAGKPVELAPLTPKPERLLADYRRDVFGQGKSPFVLPVPRVIYTPRLDIPISQRVMRGDRLSFRARARGLNPDKGTARFALGKDAPQGMTIDEKSGDVRWKPTDKDRSTTYRVEIAMLQGTSEKPLRTGTVRVELRDPNVPPTLKVVSRHSGFLGTEIEFQATATDPDGRASGLRFSLSRAPGGAEIDSRTGVFRWTPGDDLDPGDYDFNVVVTDSAGDSVRKGVTISLKQNAEKFTKLIGIIAEDGKREAWLYDISTKDMQKLHEAEPFEAAGISGFIYVIGRDFIEFQASKKSYRLSLGSFLSERQLLKTTAAKPKSAKSSVASAGKPK